MPTFGTRSSFNGNYSSNEGSVEALDETHFVLAFADGADSSHGKVMIGTVAADGSISYGSKYEFYGGDSRSICIKKIDATHFVLTYCKFNNDNSSARYCTVSNGNEISLGAESQFASEYVFGNRIALLDSTHFVVTYVRYSGKYLYAAIGTISGTSISFGSYYTIGEAASLYYNSLIKIDSTHFAIVYGKSDNTYGRAVIGTVSSGNVISFGTKYNFNTGNTDAPMDVGLLDSTHLIISFIDGADSSKGKSVVATIANGNELSFGSEAIFHDGTTYYGINILIVDSSSFYVMFIDTGDSYKGKIIKGTISGTTITFDTEEVFESGIDTGYAEAGGKSASWLSSSKMILEYRYNGSPYNCYVIVGALSNAWTQTLTESVTVTDSISKKAIKVISESMSVVEAIVKKKIKAKALTELLSMTEIFTKISQYKRTLSENYHITDTIKKTLQRKLSESVSITENFSKKAKKIFSDSLSIADEITALRVIPKGLSETITMVDTVRKNIGKTLTDTIHSGDTMIRKIRKIFSEELSLLETFTKRGGYRRVLTESATITDRISKGIKRNLRDTYLIIDTLKKKPIRTIAERFSMTEYMYGKLNGVNIKYFKKYTDKAGTYAKKYSDKIGSYTKKYADKAGDYIKKYFKDI